MPDYRFQIKVLEIFPINSVVQWLDKDNSFNSGIVIGYSLGQNDDYIVDCRQITINTDYSAQNIVRINPRDNNTQLTAILSQNMLYL